MTPQEFQALLDGPAPQPEATAPVAPAETASAQTPGLASRIAGDIGTGVTELPRAVLKGARDATQETGGFLADADRWFNENVSAVGHLGPSQNPLPALPAVDAPKSTTGKLAATVSQFITGMVGLGKITKPLEAASGLANAGRAAKITAETAKAATVGAVAFDPSGERLSNIIESIPAISNPVSQFLQAQPGDSRALGRVKNALESIGMDAALVGGIMAGTKAYRAIAEWKAGKGSAEEVQKALAEAQRAEAAGAKVPEAPTAEAAPAPVLEAPAAPGAPARDVMDLGSVPKAAEPEVLSVQRVDTVPADAPPAPKLTDITDEQVAGIMASTKSDMDAYVAAGGWNEAISEGHTFGRGERIPWQKLLAKTDVQAGGENPELPLAAFMRRVADGIEGEINKARGGNAEGVLTDRMADFAWRQRVEQWGDSPQQVIGLLSQAGKNARSAVANYEAGLALGFKATQDAYGMAWRIRSGDLSAWGGDKAAAHNALREMLQVVATINGSTEALKASFGRGLRRTRAEFALSSEALAKIKNLDGDQLTLAISGIEGNPALLKKIANPRMVDRLQDVSQWLLVNNLLWGFKTHTVNLLTNAYMGMARPMERVIGSFAIGGSEGATMRAQAWQQYAYMGQSLIDGFQSASRAWEMGDSILTPHKVEANAQGINVATIPYKTPDNVAAIMHNIGVAGIKFLGLPTRSLGVMDELFKQVTYRSKVLAEAHVAAAAEGLSGKELSQRVQQALLDAFDDAGRGVNLSAVQEAKIATFSQELLPNTLGSGTQYLAQNVPLVRVILPFIKTPTNVLRYGQKLTPGLNMLQTEYRQMLSGKVGPEAQAQAIGQLSMGSLYLGAAALLATSGFITGGGPSDRRQQQLLKQAGWQPYSFVTLDEKGNKRYTSYGKYDPVAMPLGIVADMVDASGNWDDEAGWVSNFTDVSVAALMGIAKQIGQKSYLFSLNATLEAIMDPDRSMGKVAAGTATNFVPASSLLRNANQMFFDQHMRDARGLADRVMAITPGLSDKVPPKRDVWGDPVTVSRGLWVTNEKDAVDAEVRRMITEEGAAFGPSPYLVGGVDLRDIIMANGRNAYDQYQDWVGRPNPKAVPLKENVAKIIRTPAYRKAPDGDAGTRGTKQWMITGVISNYRAAAAQRLRADKAVREAMHEKQRDVAKAYAASKAPPPPQQNGGLGAIGRAFGVDLGGLAPQQ